MILSKCRLCEKICQIQLYHLKTSYSEFDTVQIFFHTGFNFSNYCVVSYYYVLPLHSLLLLTVIFIWSKCYLPFCVWNLSLFKYIKYSIMKPFRFTFHIISHFISMKPFPFIHMISTYQVCMISIILINTWVWNGKGFIKCVNHMYYCL